MSSHVELKETVGGYCVLCVIKCKCFYFLHVHVIYIYIYYLQ